MSLFKIRGVTHHSTPRSVQWKKLKTLYIIPIRHLAHSIHWYHKCFQRTELVLICTSIPFIEHESAHEKRTYNYCTYFAISNFILWTCSTMNSVQQINSKNSSCHRYSVYNICIVRY